MMTIQTVEVVTMSILHSATFTSQQNITDRTNFFTILAPDLPPIYGTIQICFD